MARPNEFVERLKSCGLDEQDAGVLVADFCRDLDFAGLADYVAKLELLHAINEKYEQLEILQP